MCRSNSAPLHPFICAIATVNRYFVRFRSLPRLDAAARPAAGLRLGKFQVSTRTKSTARSQPAEHMRSLSTGRARWAHCLVAALSSAATRYSLLTATTGFCLARDRDGRANDGAGARSAAHKNERLAMQLRDPLDVCRVLPIPPLSARERGSLAHRSPRVRSRFWSVKRRSWSLRRPHSRIPTT